MAVAAVLALVLSACGGQRLRHPREARPPGGSEQAAAHSVVRGRLADRIAVLDRGRVLQVDTPVELYRRPRGRFVAGFVGSNNLLPRLSASGGLEVPGVGVLPAPLGAGTGAKGGAGIVAVRPESIRLAAADAHGTEAVPCGTVLDVSFHGGSSRIAVAVAGLEAPVLVTTEGPAAVTAGTRVAPPWDPGSAVLIETE